MFAPKEISTDASVAVVFFRTGWLFHNKNRTKNGTGGFPLLSLPLARV